MQVEPMLVMEEAMAELALAAEPGDDASHRQLAAWLERTDRGVFRVYRDAEGRPVLQLAVGEKS